MIRVSRALSLVSLSSEAIICSSISRLPSGARSRTVLLVVSA